MLMEDVSAVLEQAHQLVKDDDLDFPLTTCDEDMVSPDLAPISPASSNECMLPSSTRSIAAAAPPSAEKPVKAKKRTWKKPKDKPKRPLSAYNIFFQHEREKIITDTPEKTLSFDILCGVDKIAAKHKEKRRHRKTHGKIGFADLARHIAAKWKDLDEASKARYEGLAETEKARYKRELEEWNRRRHEKKEAPAGSPVDVGGDDGDNRTDSEGSATGPPPEVLPKHSLGALMAQSHRFLQQPMMQQHHHHPHHANSMMHAPTHMPSMLLSYPSGGGNPYMNNFPFSPPAGARLPDYLDVTHQTVNVARSALNFHPNMFPGMDSGLHHHSFKNIGGHFEPYFSPINEDHDPSSGVMGAHDDGGVCLDPHAGMHSPNFFDTHLAPPRMFLNPFELDHSGHHRNDDLGNFMEHFERE